MFRCPNSKEHNEFEVYPLGVEIGVLVDREGCATNRWADGTIGVNRELLRDAEEETEAVCAQCGSYVQWGH